MNKELELLKKRNEVLALECVEAYKPVKQLSPEFQDYEPPGVRIEGKIQILGLQSFRFTRSR